MSSEESINFLDLACIFKMTQDTTLERFGSTINASVFDAANISGALKQKGLIDFTAYYPGPNTIVVTDAGKKLKEDAEAKSTGAIDPLDDEILKQLSGGKRLPLELQNTLNIRPLDLAFRIYKLFKQNMLEYQLKNGTVELMLTEQGFLRAKTPQNVQTPQAAPPPQTQPQVGQAGQATTQNMQKEQGQGPANIEQIRVPKKRGKRIFFAVIIVLTIIMVLLLLYYFKIIKIP